MKELDANIQGKIMKYCAYQDRSISEVIDKLYKLEVWKEEHDKYINYLIDNLFLDEIRYTASFVRGKFRIKHWGKQKIKMHLKQKGIANSIIEKCINEEIDKKEYYKTASELIDFKANTLSETNPFKRKQKLANYLLQKGYESDIVFSILN